jgi:diguanylate cyclase (GGDEF)-like protein
MDIDLLKDLVLLYVEDEKFLQDEVSQNIAPFVKEIILASDGLKGLELFKEHHSKIDLIISDIMMPNMDGIEMIDNIRQLDSDIPVIYATAFNESSYLLKTIQQSVSGYILKPIDIELLIAAIEKSSVFIQNKKLKEQLLLINENLEERLKDKMLELETQNKQLQDLLSIDSLSQLPNRYTLLKDLETLESPTLVLFDIDSFKNINDLYGEDVGNFVLMQVSDMLKKYVEYYSECKLYRIGADEFVLVRSEPFDEDECNKKIEFLLSTVEGHKIFLNEEKDLWIHLNATIGISANSASPLSNADIALRRAKNKKISYYIFKEEENLHKEYEDDLKYSKIISKAVEENLVVPYYQPIVNNKGEVVKYEALMRIISNNEVLSPYFFLDISKKIKQYNALEEMMIKKVFEHIKEKQVYVNINVSIEDVTNDKFLEFILKELQNLGDCKYITFEFLEDESILDYAEITKFVDIVKSYGAKFAVDDFGSGYSNFSHIVNLNLDYLKIDASLVKNIDKDKNAYIVVKTINNYAHSLGLKTVAEFVHSKEVFDILNEMGIDFFQGYYFGEPQQ